MATLSGRNASVKLGTNLVSERTDWDINPTRDEIDTTVFGSTWGKSDVGMGHWNGNANGFYDPADTYQDQLIDAFYAGTLVTNIRFYVNNTSYWTPDITSASGAGCRITSLPIKHDKGGVASISFAFSGSGPITFV